MLISTKKYLAIMTKNMGGYAINVDEVPGDGIDWLPAGFLSEFVAWDFTKQKGWLQVTSIDLDDTCYSTSNCP